MSQLTATALIFDGHLSSALAAARDLRARGVRVIVGASRRTAMTLHSCAVADSFVYPDPKLDQLGYLQTVKNVAERERTRSGRLVVPYFFSDDTFLPLARASEETRAAFAWAFSSLTSVETCFDKTVTLRAAHSLGLPIPESIDRFAVSADSYPLIVKPRHSCVWPTSGSAVRGTAVKVNSETELAEACAKIMTTTGEEPLLQWCIVGEEVGVFTVRLDGKPCGWFSHRRLLGIHPDGGASSIRLSVPVPKQLVEWSTELLAAIDWNGPAMVEWKYDEATQTYRLMEINGRWWGSLALTLAANYPAVWYWYLHSTGQALPSSEPSVRSGVRAIHSLAVVKCVLSCLRLGRFKQAARAVRLCIPSSKQIMIFDVESWRDPAPIWWEMLDVIARSFRTG